MINPSLSTQGVCIENLVKCEERLRKAATDAEVDGSEIGICVCQLNPHKREGI